MGFGSHHCIGARESGDTYERYYRLEDVDILTRYDDVRAKEKECGCQKSKWSICIDDGN